jgi:hypothetical protein
MILLLHKRAAAPEICRQLIKPFLPSNGAAPAEVTSLLVGATEQTLREAVSGASPNPDVDPSAGPNVNLRHHGNDNDFHVDPIAKQVVVSAPTYVCDKPGGIHLTTFYKQHTLRAIGTATNARGELFYALDYALGGHYTTFVYASKVKEL